MGDVWCGWCGARIQGSAVGGRRYCRPAHRQAAWRARRRWSQAATAREGMTEAGEDLICADRQAGASWAQIGAGLGISAEAARGRFGRTRGTAAAARTG